jgi:hypothetical protein
VVSRLMRVAEPEEQEGRWMKVVDEGLFLFNQVNV